MPLYEIISFFFILLTYKFGDWKNWRLYYCTMLFLAFGDLIYNLAFKATPLWLYSSPFLSHNQIDLLFIIVVFPCMLLFYLPLYPNQKPLGYQFIYVLLWILTSSIFEWFLSRLHYIKYYNGWNFFLSMLFYCFMFPLLRLHQSKPLWAMLLSSICGMTLLFIFTGTLAI